MAQAVSSTGDRTRGELVRGERWVDRSSDKADIVYYLVE
jgi:hypothetical protein